MPKVSVIVPNYNHEKYLIRRLHSIFNQSFKDFEVIFLDDASTDNSVETYKQFKDDRVVKEVFSKSNSGSPFIQWNKGVQIAKGEYLWFAESDDWCDTEFLSDLVKILDENPDVGIVYCQSSFIDEEDKVVGSNLEFTNDIDTELWKKDFIMEGKEFCSKYEIFKNPVHNASSALLRKSIWDKAGYADENMKRCGDWMQIVKMLEYCDIAFISKHLNYYRNNPLTWKPEYPQILKIKDEEYRILSYINDRFDVSISDINKRLDQLSEQWVGRIVYNSEYTEQEKINNVFKYYFEFKKYDENLKSRVLKNITSEYKKKVANKIKEKLGNKETYR